MRWLGRFLTPCIFVHWAPGAGRWSWAPGAGAGRWALERWSWALVGAGSWALVGAGSRALGAGSRALGAGRWALELGAGHGRWALGTGAPKKSKVVTAHRLMRWLGRFMVPCILVPPFVVFAGSALRPLGAHQKVKW